ncbi:MAG: hypothetical protein V9G12_01530 [Microthrixaceae bacterium]
MLSTFPALRRRQGDAEFLVIEVATARDTLLPALAERHALDGLLVTRPPVVGVIALVLRGDALDVGQALIVAGVRRQPVGAAGSGASFGLGLFGGIAFLVLEHRDHVDHVLRVVLVAR